MATDRTPIGDKVAYVKGEGQIRDHHCHWPGCSRQVPPAMWGCPPHWYTLPKHLRGQERTLTPSREYLQVADEVQAWIRQHLASKAPPAQGKLL